MENRISEIVKNEYKDKHILYLSQRDHRTIDNYSLNHAILLAQNNKSCLFAGTCLDKIKMNERQKIFINEGLISLSKEYKDLDIEFVLVNDIYTFIKNQNIGCIVTEFSTLRSAKEFQAEIRLYCEANKISFVICDSHNIVPCNVLSTYSRTPKSVKTKLYKEWPKYFKSINKPIKLVYNCPKLIKDDSFENVKDLTKSDENTLFKGGTRNGLKMLDNFIKNKLPNYKSDRNKVSEQCISDLSPWIHTGQLGIITIIEVIYKSFSKDDVNVLCFIDELFGWKQIAEHFCHHEPNYDNINGALPWAYETLKSHQTDKRDKIYSLSDLEMARTDDDQWNAGQKELVTTGKMHGYVRMYWAKKLLYWTMTPETAIEYAIYLNDKYSIDGNDPNGYLGVMWSICGTMDQGWRECNIRGKIRGMNGIRDKVYTQKWKNITLK